MGEFDPGRTVHFRSDGLALSPAEYAELLLRLAENDGAQADEFSREGAVAALEERMAVVLDKEAAVFCPAARWPITWRFACWRPAAGASCCSRTAISTTTRATAPRS